MIVCLSRICQSNVSDQYKVPIVSPRNQRKNFINIMFILKLKNNNIVVQHQNIAKFVIKILY